MKRFDGKAALVTGGAGGIGEGIVARLVTEGARVAVADIDKERAAKVAAKFGEAAFAVEYDAGNEASVDAAIAETVSRLDGIDVLVNGAAATDPALQHADTTAPDIPLDVWRRVLAINLDGYMLGCRFAIPHMVRRGGGSIVNIASDSGLSGDVARIAYGTSKGAILTLTKYIATQHGHEGIRCNAVLPGVIMTEALVAAVPGLAEFISPHVLTSRLGIPDDIAAAVGYFCSEDAAYVTGQCLSVDGGLLAHLPHLASLPKTPGA